MTKNIDVLCSQKKKDIMFCYVSASFHRIASLEMIALTLPQYGGMEGGRCDKQYSSSVTVILHVFIIQL